MGGIWSDVLNERVVLLLNAPLMFGTFGVCVWGGIWSDVLDERVVLLLNAPLVLVRLECMCVGGFCVWEGFSQMD